MAAPPGLSATCRVRSGQARPRRAPGVGLPPACRARESPVPVSAPIAVPVPVPVRALGRRPGRSRPATHTPTGWGRPGGKPCPAALLSDRPIGKEAEAGVSASSPNPVGRRGGVGELTLPGSRRSSDGGAIEKRWRGGVAAEPAGGGAGTGAGVSVGVRGWVSERGGAPWRPRGR